MEIRYGLIPDMSATKTLASLVRPDLARDLVWSGRTVGADEAVSIGLATRKEDDPIGGGAHDCARDRQQALAARAIRSGKALRCATRHRSMRVRRSCLETELQVALLGSANQMEAVTASMTKRDPSFVDVAG